MSILKMKFKKLFQNFLLLSLSVLIGLFAIEIALRQIGKEYFTQNNLYILSEHSVFLYKPNIIYNIKTSEYNNTIKINSKGLRDFEYSYIKPNNTFRILSIGDSFIVGEQFALEDTITKKMEERLNKNRINNSKKNIKYEVIDMGFGGLGPTAEAIVLEKEGIKYNPDMILFYIFVGNDITKIDFGTSGEIPKRIFENYESLEKIEFKVSKLKRLKNFIFRKYFTYSYIKRLFKKDVSDPVFLQKEIFNKQFEINFEENIVKFKSIFNHIKRYSKTKGINLVLIIIPTKEQIDSRKYSEMINKYNLNESEIVIGKPQKIILDFCESENISCIDLLPEFIKRNINNSYYYEIDGHWNKKGHELASMLIYEKLINISFLNRKNGKILSD